MYHVWLHMERAGVALIRDAAVIAALELNLASVIGRSGETGAVPRRSRYPQW